MSVKLAKLAVALLYAATVVVILKEFNGHGNREVHAPPERSPETIQTGLVAEVARFVLKIPEQRRAVFEGEIKSNVPFCTLVLGVIFVDTSAHEHPTEHQYLRTSRRGKKIDWREWALGRLTNRAACNSPPPDNLFGHQPIIRRVGSHQVLTI